MEGFIERDKFVIPAPGGHPPPDPQKIKLDTESKPKRKRTEEEEQLIKEGADVLLAEPPTPWVGGRPQVAAIHYSGGKDEPPAAGFASEDLEEAMESQESQDDS